MGSGQRDGTIGVFGALSIGVGGIVGGGFLRPSGSRPPARGADADRVPDRRRAGADHRLFLHRADPPLSRARRHGFVHHQSVRDRVARGLDQRAAGAELRRDHERLRLCARGLSLPYLPEAMRPVASHVISSAALILLGLVNYAGSALVEKSEGAFNAGKLAVLALFIVVGLFASGLDWSRLAPAEWASPSAIVASGMIGFLAYEGFELIANASNNIVNPQPNPAGRFPRMRHYRDRGLRFGLHRGHWPSAVSRACFGEGLCHLGRGRQLPGAVRLRDYGDRRRPRIGLGDKCGLLRRLEAAPATRDNPRNAVSFFIAACTASPLSAWPSSALWRSQPSILRRSRRCPRRRAVVFCSSTQRSTSRPSAWPTRRGQPVHPRTRRPPVPRCARNHDLGIRFRSVHCEPGCRYRRDRARLYRH